MLNMFSSALVRIFNGQTDGQRAELNSKSSWRACAMMLGTALVPNIVGPTPAFAKPNQPILTIATYRSFVGTYGPGDQLEKLFRAQCQCTLKWVTSTDAGSLLTDLKFGKFAAVDVILGFDQFQVEAMKATGKLIQKGLPDSIKHEDLHPAIRGSTNVFQPIDFGFFAFMYDAEKIKNPPTDLDGWLSSPELARSIALQDPRTSSPGYGLLAWIHQSSNNEKTFKTNLARLKKQALSFSKGWSESYGLLTKGEAKAAFSYVTSEVYHRVEEKSARYKAALLTSGHPMQIEFAARTNRKSDTETEKLATSFMEFLASTTAQSAIAQKNWMLPVTESAAKVLPAEFLEALQKPKAIILDNKYGTSEMRKQLVNSWKASY